MARDHEYPTFVTHLECAFTAERHEPDVLYGLLDAGKPLLVRYDLAQLSATLDRGTLSRRGRRVCGATLDHTHPIDWDALTTP